MGNENGVKMMELAHLMVFVFLVFTLCGIVIAKDNSLYKSFLVGISVGITAGVLQWLTIR